MAAKTAISPSIMMPPETKRRRASLRRSRSAAGSSGASSSLSYDVMANPLEKLTFRVEPEAAGARLDAFLASHAVGFSRSRLKALIKDGRVTLEGRALDDPNARLAAGADVALF